MILSKKRVGAPPVLEQGQINAYSLIAQQNRLHEMQGKLEELSVKLKQLQEDFAYAADLEQEEKVVEIERQIKHIQTIIGIRRVQIDKITKEAPPSVILFDEIEKGHPDLWDILLQIFADGELDMGYGGTTSFHNSFVFLTSNVGSRAVASLLAGHSMGFSATQKKWTDHDIYQVVINETERMFPPELVGRMRENIIVFRPLSPDQLRIITDRKIDEFCSFVTACPKPFSLSISPAARGFIFENSCDHPADGARRIEGKLKLLLEDPLTSLAATRQLERGDAITVDLVKGKLVFLKTTESVHRTTRYALAAS